MEYIYRTLIIIVGSTPEISLCLADFEVGLDGFTPAALKNVSLHKPGEAGWTDVGGLYDVRNTLVETLQWPTKVSQARYIMRVILKQNGCEMDSFPSTNIYTF